MILRILASCVGELRLAIVSLIRKCAPVARVVSVGIPGTGLR